MTQLVAALPFAAELDAKLGRCARCMRLARQGSMVSGAVFAFAYAAGAPAFVLLPSGVVAAAFIVVAFAHAVAYAVRGPAPVTGCVPCAEKARAHERKLRWERRWGWLRGRMRPATAKACRTCRSRSQEEILGEADFLPGADEALLTFVERSPEFATVAARLTSPDPEDTWQANMQHHFLFALAPDDAGVHGHALFAARWEDERLVSAVVVEVAPDSDMPQVRDIRTGAILSLDAPSA